MNKGKWCANSRGWAFNCLQCVWRMTKMEILWRMNVGRGLPDKISALHYWQVDSTVQTLKQNLQKRIAWLLSPHTFAKSDCTMLRRSSAVDLIHPKVRISCTFFSRWHWHSCVHSVYTLLLDLCWTLPFLLYFTAHFCWTFSTQNNYFCTALYTVVGLWIHVWDRLVVQSDHWTFIKRVAFPLLGSLCTNLV